MEVNHEVEPLAPHALDYAADAKEREHLPPITKRNAINRNRRIRITRQLDDGRAGLSNSDSDARVRKPLADSAQRGQTQDHIAELAEVYDEYVVRVESHKQLIIAVRKIGRIRNPTIL